MLREPTLFPQVCELARHSGGLSLILWEEETKTTLRELLRHGAPGHDASARLFSVNILVGPEGGFSRDEVGIARRYGLVPVTMGPRILRGETAGLAAVAVILYEMGDME